jgi:hypothetical protein
MKKVLLSVLLVLSLMLIGCGGEQQNDNSSVHVHEYSNNWSSDNTYHYKKCTGENCGEKIESQRHLFVGKFTVLEDDTVDYTDRCIVCNKEITKKALVAYDYLDADNIFDTLEENTAIYLKAGDYRAINLSVDGISIGGEDGVTVDSIKITASLSQFDKGLWNYTFYNLNFNPNEFGFEGEYNLNNVNFINCKFSGLACIRSSLYAGVENRSINNLLVDGCSFTNLHNGRGTVSAITITKLSDFTLRNSLFDDIDFNALQLGEKEFGGKIEITGNIFKNIGNRVAKLLETETVSNCVIENNKFYALTLGDSLTDKRSGNYFQTIDGNIKVGVNYWEEIPPNETMYFISGNSASPIIYNPSEQLLIEE